MRNVFLRFLVVLFVCLYCVQAVSAQQATVTYSVSKANGLTTVTFFGSGFAAYTPFGFSRTLLNGGCVQYQNGTWQLGAVSYQGTFVFADQVCAGVYAYAILVGSQSFSYFVQTEPVSSQPVPTCNQSYSLQVGMKVGSTKSIEGWMEPGKSVHSYGGEPIFKYVAGKEFTLIEGPVCNKLGTWWRLSDRFTFDHLGQPTPSERIFWTLDETNGTKTLFQLPNTAIEMISYPLFSQSYPEAVSVLSVQGQRVFDNPTLNGSRVAALKRADGLVQVTGINASGTFLKVHLASGQEGWICAQFTKNNVPLFYVPVVDQSTEECYIK